MAHPSADRLRRADYWLFGWQIAAIHRIADDCGLRPSQVVRALLADAIDRVDRVDYPDPSPSPSQVRPRRRNSC